jgi:murein DD-endopeptidase MepM/ murein hydrolase activator NlpD
VAFVIISAGPVAGSRTHTFGARAFALAAAGLVLVIVALSMGLGYRMAQVQPAGPAQLDVDQPEGRALVGRIGMLASRLSKLESEAAALAKRLGGSSASGNLAAGTVEGAVGGPFVQFAAVGSLPAAFSAVAEDHGSGLGLAELRLMALESVLGQLTDSAAGQVMETMAFPSRLPLAGEGVGVSSTFGVRHDPFTGQLARHAGLDIPAPRGTPILASGGGRVIAAGYRGAYGQTVIIDHGDGLKTLYGHASKLLVRAGDVVMPQQEIALVGSTGRSSGPHLHFEVIRDGQRVDPGPFLAEVLPGAAR